ncbi:MAG: TonB family protein [Paludibacteraceae bacterium]|nr:TonB family protein [Paludibacteraceae bacterium]
MKNFQSHTIAGIGTLVLMLLLLLLLFKLSMHAPLQMEDEGIVITFGETEEGGGMPDALPLLDPMTQIEQQATAPAPQPEQPSNNDLIVQEDEESLALAQQTEEEKKRQAQEEDLIRKQKEEEARQEAERIAQEKALAEQKAREQEAIDKAQQLASLFGQAASITGANADNANNTPTASSKGNPVGKNFGQVDGNMWTLQGRSVKTIPKPSTDFNEQGKVVVSIRVDKAGNVVIASIGDGTTISDRHTQQLALDAARKAKFSEGEHEQIGSITYNFKLN